MVLLAGVGLVIFIALLASWAKWRKQVQSTGPGPMVVKTVRTDGELPVAANAPTSILIGESAANPLLTITNSSATADYERGTVMDIGSRSISRLSALLQAAPALMVAQQAAGKRLMEVVINGDLVRAADGHGMRAFSMGADGIRSHAKLFDVQQLENMINAAAVWQVASVLVAQKHLADISAKLDEIKAGVDSISRFLDDQRKSRIEAAYNYLGQAYRAIQGGELSDSVRSQLEDCERDLLEIQLHLDKEFRARAARKVEDKEMIGTEDLTNNIKQKIAELNTLTQDIALCIQTRVLAWHVLSLYPGEPQLKLARRESIEQAIAAFQKLGPLCSEQMESEIASINSLFNRESTLNERRASLRSLRDNAVTALGNKADAGQRAVSSSAQRLLTLDQPQKLLFEYAGNQLVGAREVVARAA